MPVPNGQTDSVLKDGDGSQTENDKIKQDSDNLGNKKDVDNPDGQDAEKDNPKWDDETKKYIQNLRKENAKYRNNAKTGNDDAATLRKELGNIKSNLAKALGLDDDSKMTPEEQIGSLKDAVAQRDFALAVRELALDNGISNREAVEFLEYRIKKKTESIGDEDEISEEDMAEIIDGVKKTFSSNDKSDTNSSTSVNSKTNSTPSSGDGNAPTLDEFVKMTVTEKGILYGKNPTVYTRLMSEARDKKRI